MYLFALIAAVWAAQPQTHYYYGKIEVTDAEKRTLVTGVAFGTRSTDGETATETQVALWPGQEPQIKPYRLQLKKGVFIGFEPDGKKERLRGTLTVNGNVWRSRYTLDDKVNGGKMQVENEDQVLPAPGIFSRTRASLKDGKGRERRFETEFRLISKEEYDLLLASVTRS